MPKTNPRGRSAEKKRKIEEYTYADKKRVNNPPVGLVTPQTDPPTTAKKTYAYDPHLDPQLVWAGKAEHTSFAVPTVSLHVHERIEPRTIIEAVCRKNGNGGQLPLFASRGENPPLREAVEFYKHAHDWSNRLIAGDSLLVMNSLLEKEGLGGQLQMIYIDPPYGIDYGSNFQPFVNRRIVKDRKDDDLVQEPEMVKAFRDTWELGLHSYLTYLRDRLLLSRELLSPTGSVFVQIGDENLHYVRELMDEVFDARNFAGLISFQTKIPLGTKNMAGVCDYLLWYARDLSHMKFHRMFVEKTIGPDSQFNMVELKSGERRAMTAAEKADTRTLPTGAKVFTSLAGCGKRIDFRVDRV